MKIILLVLVVLHSVHLGISQNAEYLEISLEQGPVRGFLSDDQQHYSFTGIPYATAPTGQDKFKAPLPAPTWTETFNANNVVMCPQITRADISSFTEDCLVVNIFIPAGADLTASLPVLVYVHGGAYLFGSGATDMENRVLNQDIVVVTFNYRLNALGYVCLRTEDIPGNAASKDQVMALQWVQNNIARFGGNPADVTIYGTSAGSASTHLLILSNATQGLFNKAIMESGAAINGWSMSYEPIEEAKILANLMGYNAENVEQLSDFLKNASVEDLVSATYHFYRTTVSHLLVKPCVEIDFDGTAFLTDSPMNIIRSGNYNQVPMIISYMNMEGLLFSPDWAGGWNEIYESNIEEFLHFDDMIFENDVEKRQVAERIKEFYLNRTETNFLAFVDMQTDMYYFYTLVESARFHTANGATVYLMEFSYHDNSSEFFGAAHGALGSYVFERASVESELTSDRITTLFGNFIKTGNPIPTVNDLLPVTWSPVTADTLHYLSFADELSTGTSPRSEQYNFWVDIYSRYYRELPLPAIEVGVSSSNIMNSFYGLISSIIMFFIFNSVLRI